MAHDTRGAAVAELGREEQTRDAHGRLVRQDHRRALDGEPHEALRAPDPDRDQGAVPGAREGIRGPHLVSRRNAFRLNWCEVVETVIASRASSVGRPLRPNWYETVATGRSSEACRANSRPGMHGSRHDRHRSSGESLGNFAIESA